MIYPAVQAQIDWKENIKFLLHDGTYITFNILLMTLVYSRYKLAKVTFDRTTETLQDALVEFFEQLQGVPHVLLTDNMKTVMVQPRLAGTKGQLHTKAEHFSNDFGFACKPCIARRPQTKGKVEKQAEDIVFLRSSGVGKTHLATSIGIESSHNRRSTYFIKCHDLIQNLKPAKDEERLETRLKHYVRYQLLIIDEIGYLPLQPDAAEGITVHCTS